MGVALLKAFNTHRMMIKKKKITYLSEESENSGIQIRKLKAKLKECQKEKEEYLTQAQRARADLVNYRRRQEETMEELRKFGQAGLISELLSVLESLEAGVKKNKDLEQVKNQMDNILGKYGLEEIKTKGEQFNPQFHEAVERVESEKERGVIVEEIQKGYLLNNKVLRPSKVKVGK